MDGLASAIRILPDEVRKAALQLTAAERSAVSELRLRRGQAPTWLAGGEERLLPGCGSVTAAQLARVLELCSDASPYAVRDTLRQGFITVPGGVRVGFCGEAVTENGAIRQLRELTSVCIRIPGEHRGCARSVLRLPFRSTLLISPPGAGKTTLLRDMIRLLSESGERVGLCDERSEIAAVRDGVPGFDVGCHTDVLSAVPKSEAAMLLLRCMSPTVIAMDEITAPGDAAACRACANCGVSILATAHAASAEELQRRPLYRSLLRENIFALAVLICRDGVRRSYREIELC